MRGVRGQAWGVLFVCLCFLCVCVVFLFCFVFFLGFEILSAFFFLLIIEIKI